MISVANRGSRPKSRTTEQVRKARGNHLRWTFVTAVALPLTAAFGGTLAVWFAPAFSGSLLISALVILAVASSLASSRLGALEDMEAELNMHDVAPHIGPHKASHGTKTDLRS